MAISFSTHPKTIASADRDRQRHVTVHERLVPFWWHRRPAAAVVAAAALQRRRNNHRRAAPHKRLCNNDHCYRHKSKSKNSTTAWKINRTAAKRTRQMPTKRNHASLRWTQRKARIWASVWWAAMRLVFMCTTCKRARWPTMPASERVTKFWSTTVQIYGM